MSLKWILLIGITCVLGFIVVVAVVSESGNEQTQVSKTDEEIAVERYTELISEYGRDQAGTMIQKEIKDAWDAEDFERVELLTNASAAAMLQDHERSKNR